VLGGLRQHPEVYDVASAELQCYLRVLLGKHYKRAVRGFKQRANELLSPLGWGIDSLTAYNFQRQGAGLAPSAALVVNYWHDPFVDMNWPDADGLLTSFGPCPYATTRTVEKESPAESMPEPLDLPFQEAETKKPLDETTPEMPRAKLLPVTALVEALALPPTREEAVDAVLRRLAEANPACRESFENSRKGEPRYAYRVSLVWPSLLEALPRWK
jgi:hypothetical protein